MTPYRPGRREFRPKLRGQKRPIRIHAVEPILSEATNYLKKNGFPAPTMEGEFRKLWTRHGECFARWHGPPEAREYEIEVFR